MGALRPTLGPAWPLALGRLPTAPVGEQSAARAAQPSARATPAETSWCARDSCRDDLRSSPSARSAARSWAIVPNGANFAQHALAMMN